MVTREEWLDTWGYDGVVQFPRDAWIEEFYAPLEAFPEADLLPRELSVIFTTELQEGGFDLYSRINLEMDDEGYLTVLVLGAVPDAGDSMLFGVETIDAKVLLLGVETGTLEVVNSSLRHFTEFLYRLTEFVDADTGIHDRAERARHFRTGLAAVDPEAFQAPTSWWNTVFGKLGVEVG